MADEFRRLLDGVHQDPAIMVGKPVVKGTRIPVELVLGHLAHNLDLGELCAAYPELTVKDVQACLAYAHKVVARQRRRRPSLPVAEAAAVSG